MRQDRSIPPEAYTVSEQWGTATVPAKQQSMRLASRLGYLSIGI